MSKPEDYWHVAEPGSERGRIFEAALEQLEDEGFLAITLEAVAARADMSLDDVRAHFESLRVLLSDLALETSWRSLIGALPGVEACESGTDALEKFIRAHVAYCSSQSPVFFQVGRSAPQILPDSFLLNDRLRRGYAGFGPAGFSIIERKLIAELGETELPQGLHPRRLPFVGLIMANGYLDFKFWLKSRGIDFRHNDEDVIEEMVRAICSPPRIIAQLDALNRASAELVGMGSEAELVQRAPRMLLDALGLDGAALDLDGHELASAGSFDDELRGHVTALGSQTASTHSLELGVVVCPIQVRGSSGGSLAGYRASGGLEHQLVARLETFASMAGLALENIRLVDNLNARVEERTRELRDAQAALVQAEKMASLGQLVAGVAHELNTPLGAVESSRDSMTKASARVRGIFESKPGPTGVDDRQNRKLQAALKVLDNAGAVMGDGTARIEAIVTRLRSFARLDQAELQEVSVEGCIEDALGLAAHSLRGIDVVCDFSETPKIRCYPARLNQAFSNVINNCIEAMDGGELRIATSVRGEDLVVTIEDEGHGVEPEHLGRVFDPGFTTRSVGVGTGLGLSIAYQIVSDHDGTITLESELGRGTSVTITLPSTAR